MRLVKAYQDASALDAMPEQVTRNPPPSASCALTRKDPVLTHQIPVPTPDFSKPVFFRARKDCSPVVLPEYVHPLFSHSPCSDFSPRSGEMFAFSAGSQHMCRYSTIRALLEAGDVELI